MLCGVPTWLTDAELRKHGAQFGALRNLRPLKDSHWATGWALH